MIRDISRLTRHPFDLIVIGGGINGAAIAKMAAACGIKVALLEKGDFAGGTSSKSTKLLHGGIRYLENFEFDLVHEALRERYIQWQAVPYLAQAMPFVVPVYKNDRRPLWMMKIGVCLYDLLSGKYKIGRYRFLSVGDITSLAPGISRQGLIGGVEYFDVQMDDARICLENVLMADLKGAAVANYIRAEDFIKEQSKIIGVRARDTLSGKRMDILGEKIIVAAGPWADELIAREKPNSLKRLRPTKGVHIVYKGEISPNAFLLQSRQDKRIFFIIPFKGNSLIGTTDTDYNGNPNDVRTEEADIQYLLQEAGRIFPNITFDRSKIITTFAGLRPLVTDTGDPSKISRKHVIERHASGVYFVMGGKYTTYRAIAEESLLKVMPELAPKMPYAGQYVLYGSGGSNEELKILGSRYGVPLELVRYLQGIYGNRFGDVLDIAKGDEHLKSRICSCSPTIGAQIVYSRDVEMAQTPEDIIERRLGLAYLDCPTGDCRKFIDGFFKKHS